MTNKERLQKNNLDLAECLELAESLPKNSGGEYIEPILQEKTVTENGDVTPDVGYDGLSKVSVNVPAPVLQDKTVTENGTYTADEGYDALETVTVEVPDPVLQEKTATVNGDVTPDAGYDGLSKVTVAVEDKPPVLQEKTATENGDVTPDSGYDGLSKVTVDVPEPNLQPAQFYSGGTYYPRDFDCDGFSEVSIYLDSYAGGVTYGED